MRILCKLLPLCDVLPNSMNSIVVGPSGMVTGVDSGVTTDHGAADPRDPSEHITADPADPDRSQPLIPFLFSLVGTALSAGFSQNVDGGQGWDGGRHRGHSAWDYTHNHHSLHRTADHDETLQAARDGFKVRRRKRRRRQLRRPHGRQPMPPW